MAQVMFRLVPKGTIFIHNGMSYIKTTRTTAFEIAASSARCRTARGINGDIRVDTVISCGEIHKVAKEIAADAA